MYALLYRRFARWLCLLCYPLAHLSALAATGPIYFSVTDTSPHYIGVEIRQDDGSGTWPWTVIGLTRSGDTWSGGGGIWTVGTSYTFRGYAIEADGTTTVFLPTSSGVTVSATSGMTINLTPAPPTPWKVKKVIQNTSATRQKFRYDSDGDGIFEGNFELGPGQQFEINAQSDAEPDWNMTIERETYLGDGQWTFEGFETVEPGDWEQTETPTPNTTQTPPRTYIPPDSQSSNTNTQKIGYQAPSGGGLTESTFRTGVESLRSAQLEGSDKAAEAIDRLRAEVKGYLGFTNAPDPNATVEGLDRAPSMSAFNSAMATNAMSSAIGSLDPAIATTEVSTNFWSITLPGGRVLRWDAPEWQPLMSFAKQLMAWAAYIVYFGFALKEGWKAIHHALGAPQAVSSSSVPAISGALAFGSAVAIVISYAAILSGFVVTLSGLLYGFEDLGSWQSFTMSSPTGSGPTHSTVSYWSLAERYVPINFILQLIISGFIYEFTINAVAAAATAFVRLTAT